MVAILLYDCFHKFEGFVVRFYGAHCTSRISATYHADKKIVWVYFDGARFYYSGNLAFLLELAMWHCLLADTNGQESTASFIENRYRLNLSKSTLFDVVIE